MEVAMAPFVILISLFFLLIIAGHFEFPASFGWWTSLRLALSGMFFLTASAHWGRRRADLIKMVPPAFARADLIVTLTGILEMLGAAGLIVPTTAPYAAMGLSLLLVAVFPANIYAATHRLSIAGQRALPLLPRTLLQVLFLTATLAIFLAA
jgi:uncharacterized membrane protein